MAIDRDIFNKIAETAVMVGYMDGIKEANYGIAKVTGAVSKAMPSIGNVAKQSTGIFKMPASGMKAVKGLSFKPQAAPAMPSWLGKGMKMVGKGMTGLFVASTGQEMLSHGAGTMPNQKFYGG